MYGHVLHVDFAVVVVDRPVGLVWPAVGLAVGGDGDVGADDERTADLAGESEQGTLGIHVGRETTGKRVCLGVPEDPGGQAARPATVTPPARSTRAVLATPDQLGSHLVHGHRRGHRHLRHLVIRFPTLSAASRIPACIASVSPISTANADSPVARSIPSCVRYEVDAWAAR